jgi:hypothetical protein
VYLGLTVLRLLYDIGQISQVPDDYRSKLKAVGFESIDVEPTRIYRTEDARTFLAGQELDVDAIAPQVDGKFMSAFVRATKPKSCWPTCCS